MGSGREECADSRTGSRAGQGQGPFKGKISGRPNCPEDQESEQPDGRESVEGRMGRMEGAWRREDEVVRIYRGRKAASGPDGHTLPEEATLNRNRAPLD